MDGQTSKQRRSSPYLPAIAAECSEMASLHHHPAIQFFPSSTRATRPPPSLLRCGVAPTKKSSSYWATAEAEIDAHLAASIPTAPPPGVRDPLLSLIASATRTMAPVLCVAACELMGAPRDRAMAAACALRLLHSAFHAKRPFLGLSVLSPGRAEAVFREGVKLQTADGLLSLSYQLVAEADVAAGVDPGRVLRVMVEMADAAGPRGMMEGLYEEIRYVHEESGIRDAMAAEDGWLERVCRKKEGRLYACAAACGAILAGAGEEETERLRRCGTYVGMLHGLLQCGRGGQEEVAGELKLLALSELEGFEGEKKEAIVGLLDVRP